MTERASPGGSGGSLQIGEWRRVHPLTPVLRSWQAVVVVVAYLAQQALDAMTFGAEPDGVTRELVARGGFGLLLAVLALAAFTAVGVISWYRTRYRVGVDALEYERVVLSRQHRRAPLDRLQGVDVARPLLARVFGLARVTLEVAGGGDSRIEIAFLRNVEAHALRAHLLAAAGGGGVGPDAATGAVFSDAPVEQPERLLMAVPLGRLIGSVALSGSSVATALTLPAAIVFVVITGQIGVLAVSASTVLAAVAGVSRRFTVGYGFRVSVGEPGIQLRYGLLDHRTQTVPTDRIQAVRLHQPLLWRVFDWWAVEVNVAGYEAGGEEGAIANTTLLPVGTLDDVRSVLGAIVPDLDLGDEAVTGRDDAAGFTAAPRQARWIDPVAWRRHGVRVDPAALLLRGGRLRRHVDVVPHARTQGIGAVQGPVQRRLGLASFQLHSTPGPVRPVVTHLATATVAALLEEQAARARLARRRR